MILYVTMTTVCPSWGILLVMVLFQLQISSVQEEAMVTMDLCMGENMLRKHHSCTPGLRIFSTIYNMLVRRRMAVLA